MLHLSSEKTWRGGEQQIAYLIEELQKLGVDNFVAVKSDSAFLEYCDRNKIDYYPLPFKNSVDFGSAFKLFAVCKEIKPDIIHIHSSKSQGIAALATLLGLKVPMILSRRVDFRISSNFFSKWKYNLGAIKKIVCVSKAIEAIMNEQVQRTHRLVTIYDGIDLHKFDGVKAGTAIKDRFNLPMESVIIGNTSAIADHKDYFTFIDTAEEFYATTQQQNVYFVIVGDGPMREEISNYIESKKLKNRILMMGFIDHVPPVLKEFDLFLMTSKTEGLGTSVLDSFAAGVPVVSTDGGGLAEIVINNKSGLSSAVKDYKSLAENLVSLLEKPEKQKELVEKAKEFVKQFSKENMAAETLNCYEEVINQ